MNDFTFEEQNLVCIYNSSGTRAGVIAGRGRAADADGQRPFQAGTYDRCGVCRPGPVPGL